MTRISIDGVVSRTVRDTAAVYEKLTRIPNGGSFIAMGPPGVSYVNGLPLAQVNQTMRQVLVIEAVVFAAVLLLMQVLLMARIPWLERAIGQDMIQNMAK